VRGTSRDEHSRQSRHRESKQIEAFADKDDSDAAADNGIASDIFQQRFPILLDPPIFLVRFVLPLLETRDRHGIPSGSCEVNGKVNLSS
jgi:hypothetical protein